MSRNPISPSSENLDSTGPRRHGDANESREKSLEIAFVGCHAWLPKRYIEAENVDSRLKCPHLTDFAEADLQSVTYRLSGRATNFYFL